MKENSENSKETLLLIDSNALIHRAYHSYPPTLATKSGEQTNAVYGFTKMLLETIEKFDPKYIICVFDSDKPTFRHEQYEDYKANREEMDEELRVQFPRAREVVETLNIPLFMMDGYEADDLIGTLVKNEVDGNLRKIIVTGDHDILQLIDDDDDIAVYMSGSSFSKSKLYREEQVKERYKLDPIQIIDYKSLLGDSSDNIPGVKGVGKKGATDLLQQFIDLESVFKSLEAEEEVWDGSPFKRMYKKLKQQKEMAFMSKQLATIKTDIELDFDLPDAETSDFDETEVRELFQELQFRTLYEKIPRSKLKDEDRQTAVAESSDGARSQFNMFSQTESKTNTEQQVNSNYQVITDESEALKRLEELSTKEILAFDTEADTLNYMDAEMIGIGFSFERGNGIYFSQEVLASRKVKETLDELITRFTAEKERHLIAHNLKFDLHVVSNYLGKVIARTDHCFDTLIAVYLLNAGEGNLTKKLKDLAFDHLGMQMKKFEDLFPQGTKKAELLAANLDVHELGQYCCADCDATLGLYEVMKDRLEQQDLKRLFTEIEMPLVGVLLRMEREGIYLEKETTKELEDEVKTILAKLEKDIFTAAGEEFNIGSPKQVGEILFGKLKLHEESNLQAKKTKSGSFSTDERTLRNYSKDYKIVSDILYYRELSKLLSTYITALPEQINDRTEKIHTNYNQTVASTGRLSSSDPNLQNIPISSDIGRKIRKAFTASNGGEQRKLLAFDYAQQELRLLAHLSGEEKLVDAFKTGMDIHSLTASQILDVPQEQVSKEQRRIGKTVNFGVIYGISGFGLADRLKIERSRADEFIAKFYERYPAVRDYFTEVKERAKNEGAIYTIMGRKRDASALNSKNFRVRAAVEREVINFPLQGGAADIMKLAMLAVDEAIYSDKLLAKTKLKMHLQVHDELILSIPSSKSMEEIKNVAERIVALMAEVYELKVPVDVDAELGDNWYDLQAIN
jgi:DNA polymerase-1